MIEQIGIYLTSMILGIMLFFSFVIAPVIFTTLDDENARKFIRRIFPFYYIVNLVISFIVLLTFFFLSKFGIEFVLILTITILFAISNYYLMPLINKYRDEKQNKKFKYSHFISVLINFIQMIFLVLLLISLIVVEPHKHLSGKINLLLSFFLFVTSTETTWGITSPAL